jgi:hypothetical protein
VGGIDSLQENLKKMIRRMHFQREKLLKCIDFFRSSDASKLNRPYPVLYARPESSTLCYRHYTTYKDFLYLIIYNLEVARIDTVFLLHDLRDPTDALGNSHYPPQY